MSKNKSTKTVAELREEIDAAMRKQLESYLANIDVIASKWLERHFNQIVANAVGMTDHWGRLEVDHCNGRATAIADNLGALAATRINEALPGWIEANLKPGLPKGWKKAMQDEYNSQFEYQLRDRVRDAVRNMAAEQADNMAREAVKNDRELEQLFKDIGTDE
jgi:BMFP domain-containing protein YqiC